jgi:hypothetical protein
MVSVVCKVGYGGTTDRFPEFKLLEPLTHALTSAMASSFASVSLASAFVKGP